MEFNKNLLNICQMGLGFLLLFTAFQTCANIQQFVLESTYNDRNNTGPPIDNDAGYTRCFVRNFNAHKIMVNLINIIHVSIGFLLLFTAYNTCAMIQQYVIQSIHNIKNDTNLQLDKDAGYKSSAILYAVFTPANFIAPPIVDAIGQRWSMVAGAFFYLLYLVSFLYITNAFLYTSSALLGIGAAVIWVGQGSYLAKNSNDITAGRNSGIFWATFQSSLYVGGLIAYFAFNTDSDNPNLSEKEIQTVYICFSVLAAVGIIVLGFLRKPRALPGREETVKKTNLVTNFLRTIKLMATAPMLLLMFAFIFTGLEQGFWGGVYGTSLGNMLTWSDHKQLVALHGIFVGVGETLGGGIFGIFGKKLNRFGRNPVIFLGLIIHMLAFLLIFLNIASDAPVQQTENIAYITPNQYLALFCSFLLGFADACWNTQLYSLVSTYYSRDSAPAFGLYKFFQAGATCASYFYSGPGHLYLPWQLLICGITAPLGALGFVNAQWVLQNRMLAFEKD